MSETDALCWPRDMLRICSLIASEKAVLKIVTKMKNESYFAERWILHYKNILGDVKLIVFDNMSTEPEVFEVYEKYKEHILLIRFEGFMDCLHMANKFMRLYQALAASARFFAILDADEFLYMTDGAKAISDQTIVTFLEGQEDVRFFAPFWLANINDRENIFGFDPKDLWLLHLGKPIVSSSIIPAFAHALKIYECPILHHTKDLPLAAYGRAPVCFVLLHLKNTNTYQRIKSNMQKLAAFGVVKDSKDFKSLLTIHPKNIEAGHIRGYVMETRRLTELILQNDKGQGQSGNRVELIGNTSLKFYPETLRQEFYSLIGRDYFDLFHFNAGIAAANHCTHIDSYIRLEKNE